MNIYVIYGLSNECKYTNSQTLIQFVRHSMKRCKTTIVLGHSNGTLKTDQINTRNRLFQSASLSPIFIFLSHAALSSMLNSTGSGYALQSKHTRHLLSIDDLNGIAKMKEEEEAHQYCKNPKNDTRIQFELDKYAKPHAIKIKVR